MIIIFSGYNQRAVIAFLRTLKKNNIDNYAIIASSKTDTIFKTIYSNKVFYVRKQKQLDIDEMCNTIDEVCCLKKQEKAFIVPSTEALNRFLLNHRELLEQHNCIIPLVREELYKQISDKKSFCKLCRKHNILVPEEVMIGEAYAEPIVAKPKTYFSSKGEVFSPVLIQSQEEFEMFINKYATDDFMFQEFIAGESYYLLFYFSKNGDVYCFSQKNLAQQLGGKSIVVACCDNLHRNRDIVLLYQQLFKNIKYVGLVMVELRKKGNDYYMIEANPRFWGPSQLFCDSGYNFFEFFLYDNGFLNEIKKNKIDLKAKYLWSGGLNGEIMQSEDCVWYANGKEIVEMHEQEFLLKDIYNRADTMGIYYFEKEGSSMR